MRIAIRVQTARAVTRLLQPRAWEKRLRLTLDRRRRSAARRRRSAPRAPGPAQARRQCAQIHRARAGRYPPRRSTATSRPAVGALHRHRHRPGRRAGSGASSVQAFLARRYLLCAQGAGRGSGPGGRQAHRRAGGRRDRLRKRARRRRAVLVHLAGLRPVRHCREPWRARRNADRARRTACRF